MNIKSLFISFFWLISTSIPLLAMDITKITPISCDMNAEEANLAVKSFLKDEVLRPEHEIKRQDVKAVENRVAGVRHFQVLILNDNSEWVFGSGGLERFLGYLYLKKAIDHHGLTKFRAAETKFLYQPKQEGKISLTVKSANGTPLKNVRTIDSKDFISLSRYVGDTKPSFDDTWKVSEEKSVLFQTISFADMAMNANLRKVDDFIYVIDTEYRSFSSTNVGECTNYGAQQSLEFTFSG